MMGERRYTWDEYGLNLAKAVSRRSDCVRAQHGAVIMNADNRVVAVGYNGAPAGHPGCETCPRRLSQVPSLSGYDNCVSLHAEQNAIVYAGRDKCLGATIYITGEPCFWCWKTIMGSGIRRAVWHSIHWPDDVGERLSSGGVFQ